MSRQIRIKNNVIFVLPGTPAGGPMREALAEERGAQLDRTSDLGAIPRPYQAKIRTLVEQQW